MSQETRSATGSAIAPLIVGQYGQPLEPEAMQCHACRSMEATHQAGFGGYWKDLCKGCGGIVAEGREG
jgi:hypothetical protein